MWRLGTVRGEGGLPRPANLTDGREAARDHQLPPCYLEL